MNNELFCRQHGPYPASYQTCPWCAQAQAGKPGENFDQGKTQDFSSQYRTYGDDDETVPPGGPIPRDKNGFYGSGDDETQPPEHRRGRPGFSADPDETQPPVRKTRRILDPDGYTDDDDLDVTILDREDVSLMGWFIVKRSPFMRRGQVIKLKPGAIIGRSPKSAHIVIDDDKVSGLHARIQVRDGVFIVLDLGSSNGTWVNDQEAIGPVALKQDDTVRVGDTVFVLKTL